jgi:hypothetical protein
MSHSYEQHKKEVALLQQEIKALRAELAKSRTILGQFVGLIPVDQVVGNTKTWEDVLAWFKRSLK